MALPLLALAGLNVANAGLGWLMGNSQAKKANEARAAAERRRVALIRAAIARRATNAALYAQNQKGGDTYRQGLQSLYAGATQVGNTYNRAAGESGVKSGLGAAGAGLSSAAYNFARPGLDVANEQLANQQATSEMNAEVGALGGMPMNYPETTNFNPFAAAAGPLAQWSLGQIPSKVPSPSSVPGGPNVGAPYPDNPAGNPSSVSPQQGASNFLMAPGQPQGMDPRSPWRFGARTPSLMDPRLAAMRQWGWR